MSQDATYLRFAANLIERSEYRFLVIGGLARAGTSSCERLLHAVPSLFVADEFHGLIEETYLSSLAYLRTYAGAEASVWTDAGGLTWRELGLEDLLQRQRTVFTTSLMAYTRPSKFSGKDPARIKYLAVKLPGIENALLQLGSALSDTPIPLVYCCRRPVEILNSHWQMPWVKETDPDLFANDIREKLRRSVESFKAIVASGWPTFVWRTPADSRTMIDAARFLGLADEPSLSLQTPLIDEWPPDRRRQVTQIPTDTLKRFAETDIATEYVGRFLMG